MSATELLALADSRGVRISIQDGKLVCEGSQSQITELLPRLKEHKLELLAALSDVVENLHAPEGMPVMSAVAAETRRAFGGGVVVEWASEGGRTVGTKGPTAAAMAFIEPRPTVRCRDCRHFLPDAVGDGTGIGDCAVGGEGTGRFSPALWPNATRWCKDWGTQTISSTPGHGAPGEHG